MFISKQWIAGLIGLALAAGACLSEEPKEPEKFYKLEFVIKEVSGSKILNSRTYTTMVATRSRGEIRAGSKIPFAPSPNHVELIDVGVNVDVVGIKEVQDRLAFNIVAEVTSVAEVPANQTEPTIRQNKWNSSVIIPLKKPTLLFSSENVDSRSLMQVEVTATPLE